MFYKIVEKYFKRAVYSRTDEKPYVFLFSHSDFDGLKRDGYSIKSARGHNLCGYFYYYDSPRKDVLVVFEHGLFGGHRSYMKEIERLCAHGYLVYAYDHTGCMESGGEDTGGFSQSLCDLDNVISSLKEIDKLKGRALYVVGHSWGGFSALNIPLFHSDIKKIVAISGFISPKEIIYQHAHGLLGIYAKKLYRREYEKSPKYMGACALNSLSNTDTECLVLHSPNDHMVNYERNFIKLKNKFESDKRFTFITVDGVYHNPNYTQNAVLAKRDFQEKLNALLKKNKLSTIEQCQNFVSSLDWDQITEQSTWVWDKIYEFLDK